MTLNLKMKKTSSPHPPGMYVSVPEKLLNYNRQANRIKELNSRVFMYVSRMLKTGTNP